MSLNCVFLPVLDNSGGSFSISQVQRVPVFFSSTGKCSKSFFLITKWSNHKFWVISQFKLLKVLVFHLQSRETNVPYLNAYSEKENYQSQLSGKKIQSISPHHRNKFAFASGITWRTNHPEMLMYPPSCVNQIFYLPQNINFKKWRCQMTEISRTVPLD